MGRKEKLIEPINASFEDVVKTSLTSQEFEEYKKVKYEGILSLGGIENTCYVTEGGERYIASRKLQELFKVVEERDSGTRISGNKWALFLGTNWLNSLFDNDFNGLYTEAIELKNGNTKIIGYRAELIPELCEVILRARREGKLTTNRQNIIAEQCEILSSALAKVGIVALIDEATGFQFDRKHGALRILLEQYISDGLKKWIKTFPDDFFFELDRLYNNQKTTPKGRPQYYGHFINTYIYEPIEDGYVKTELNKLNIADSGERKARFHQWLTDFGKGQLTLQIGRVMGVMEMCNSIDKFKSTIKRQNSLKIWPDLFKMDD